MRSSRINQSIVSSVVVGVFSSVWGMSAAAVEFDAGGSLRLRYESRQDFNLADSQQSYWLSQVRLNLNTKFNDSHSVFTEVQDARIYGEDEDGVPFINENARNQPFADPLDLHQMYYQYQSDDITVKIGRQKFNLADGRLLASLEWVNTARVHDGIRFTHKSQDRTLDIFASSIVSIDPDDINDQGVSGNRYNDSDFHGALMTDTAMIPDHKLEYWWFYRDNNSGVFDDGIHTLGARVTGSHKALSWDVQGAWQFGDFYDIAQAQNLDHKAWMMHASASYQMLGGKLGAGYNFASGDDDPNDNQHGTFDNLYPLNHAYYGFMDLFSLQNIHNVEFTWTQPKPFGIDTNLRIAWQMFWLDNTRDAWYNAGLRPNLSRLNNALSTGADTHVGNELDITLKGTIQGVSYRAGYSYFFSEDYTQDTGNSEDAQFWFLQLRKAF